ncbi:MAG: UDP-N-acetylmuramoyl-L-alanine--D-glutamate ligase [Betaproteobacteria bacterium HGW-Betaproteobacteria-20]|nr:MAG: UDP-N-acetylmuramoyl-L-alanine--D-glutamate ligase [Betaproteobacteria bacterium HGW-Betaproteobacteria-20]
MTKLKDKKVLVLGLGETGKSVLRWLSTQGAHLFVADTREILAGVEVLKAELPKATIYTGAFKPAMFDGVDLIVASPGVPLNEPEIQAALQRGISVIGDVELFAQYRPASAKVIAITGANGKTTVTTLVGEMCKAAGLKTIVAGNIGLPVLDALSMETPDVYVLELSSFQLETTSSLQVDVATMLNLSEDHVDRYASFQDYAIAKARIFYNATLQVLNRDDAWSMLMARPKLAQVTFGLSDDASHGGTSDEISYGLKQSDGNTWLCENENELINLQDLKIVGLHNAANALAAVALCRGIGIDYAPIIQTLYNFKGLPHRVEWVANIDDVDYYDDSKGTNVGATCAALSGIAQKIVLIAGGDGKGQDFAPLKVAVAENARAVVLIGRDAPLIEAALLPAGIPLYQAIDLPEAVNIAKKLAQTGDAVLLSPACASFDMFKNYIHRAEVFVRAVNELKVREKDIA